MKIKIKLLSDLCTYSGETYNSMVDTDVVYDDYGLPYIPAKRIRGCIREAALEMQEMGQISEVDYHRIFGTGGRQENRAGFTLSNAYLENYTETVDALKRLKADPQCSGLAAQQNVLNQYTYTRAQTAVDPETGIAETNSLRVMRVVKKGLTFSAELHMLDEENVGGLQTLVSAVSLVKHMGMARTRGLGLVDMWLDSSEKNAEGKHKRVCIDRNQLGAHNKLQYRIELKSAVICKSAQGNQAETEDYMSGSKVLGFIAGTLGRARYRALLHEGAELIVSNAYITDGTHRCIPARASLQKEKDQQPEKSGAHVGSLRLTDMLYEPDTAGKQMTPAGIAYMYTDGTQGMKQNVGTEISYHHQRPTDKSIGRATGNDDGSSFYQLSSIRPGQCFLGYIYADREAAEAVLDAVESAGEIRMGYGRSSEFGAVELSIDAALPAKQRPEMVKKAIVTLASDVILYNEGGAQTTELSTLEKYLADMLGTDVEISHPFLKFTTIGGYNVTWGRRKPCFSALGKGSTFKLQSKKDFDLAKLDGAFVGERTTEGYGELKAEKPAEDAYLYVSSAEPKVETGDSAYRQTEIVQLLRDAEFKRMMQSRVREKLDDNKRTFERHSLGMNAAVAKLRLIYRDAKTYEDMKAQIEGIESEGKNGLCNDIAELIKPEEIKRDVNESMKRQYGEDMQAGSTWDDAQKLYKYVYGAYITELKHFVKKLNLQSAEEGGKA